MGVSGFLSRTIEALWRLRNRRSLDAIGGCSALLQARLHTLTDAESVKSAADSLSRLLITAEGKLRQLRGQDSDQGLPRIISQDGAENLRCLVLQDRTPWSDVAVADNGIPGMLTHEETKYYSYIGRFFSGEGLAVEVGPWLGRSTEYILRSLLGNPRFTGQKLHVFDDFIWRTWMERYYAKSDKPQEHQSFRFLFDRYMSAYQDDLVVQQRKVAEDVGNQDVARLSWNDGPIEMCFIDCGWLIEVNDGWYKVFVNHFIPNRTLIVMQDWGMCRRVPAEWSQQTKTFTDSKGSSLELVHELAEGTIATFLFRGR